MELCGQFTPSPPGTPLIGAGDAAGTTAGRTLGWRPVVRGDPPHRGSPAAAWAGQQAARSGQDLIAAVPWLELCPWRDPPWKMRAGSARVASGPSDPLEQMEC